MNKQPKTISLKEFSSNFSTEQKRIVAEQSLYYYLSISFRKAREQKGLSREELAQMANIHRSTVSRIESDASTVSFGTLVKLAAAMNMKLDVSLKFS